MRRSRLASPVDAVVQPDITFGPGGVLSIRAEWNCSDFTHALAYWERLSNAWTNTGLLPCIGLLCCNGDSGPVMEQTSELGFLCGCKSCHSVGAHRDVTRTSGEANMSAIGIWLASLLRVTCRWNDDVGSLLDRIETQPEGCFLHPA